MIVAVYNDGTFKTVYGLWQWDYGQILRIQGLNLPDFVEVHFALQEKGGTSVSRIGITKDGVTDVIIPDSMLENEGTLQDYKVYAFIYLSDEQTGMTVKEITMFVRARSKPEAFDKPEDAELFHEVIRVVNDAADRANESEKRIAVDRQAVEVVRQEVEQLGNRITETAKQGVQAINAAKQNAVEDVTQTGTAQKTIVENAGSKAVEAINSAKNEAIQTVQSEGTTQTGNVTAEGAKQIKEVQDKGAEVLQSIQEGFHLQISDIY